nr:Uncharacterised protein [Klebsiella pneumoniae]
MHAVARGQADKGAVYAAIFLFRIQALDIGRRGVDRRRQVSQRARWLNMSTLISVMNS